MLGLACVDKKVVNAMKVTLYTTFDFFKNLYFGYCNFDLFMIMFSLYYVIKCLSKILFVVIYLIVNYTQLQLTPGPRKPSAV